MSDDNGATTRSRSLAKARRVQAENRRRKRMEERRAKAERLTRLRSEKDRAYDEYDDALTFAIGFAHRNGMTEEEHEAWDRVQRLGVRARGTVRAIRHLETELAQTELRPQRAA